MVYFLEEWTNLTLFRVLESGCLLIQSICMCFSVFGEGDRPCLPWCPVEGGLGSLTEGSPVSVPGVCWTPAGLSFFQPVLFIVFLDRISRHSQGPDEQKKMFGWIHFLQVLKLYMPMLKPYFEIVKLITLKILIFSSFVVK